MKINDRRYVLKLMKTLTLEKEFSMKITDAAKDKFGMSLSEINLLPLK